MIAYLKDQQESIPSWLVNFHKDASFSIRDFCDSRVVFYAGSGFDGSPVKTFGSAHFAHCYLYTDYALSREEIISELDSSNAGFRGYKTLFRIPLTKEQLTPFGWSAHVNPGEAPQYQHARIQKSPYAFAEILERELHLDSDWGPKRLCILFIGGDAVATFDALFCQDSTKPPAVAVLQDHSFGGGYTSFGKGGLLELLAKRTIKLPTYLWVAKNSTPEWSGYFEVSGTRPVAGGEYGTPRHLFKINEYTYEDLQNLTGIDVRQIRYFVSEQLVPPPTGRTKGTRFDENHLLLLSRIKAKLDLGHSIAQIKKGLSQLRGWGTKPEELNTSTSRPIPKQLQEWSITDGVKLTIDLVASSLSDKDVQAMVGSLIAIANGSQLIETPALQSADSEDQIEIKKHAFKEAQIQKIKDNKIEEKLLQLKEKLTNHLGNELGKIGDPNLKIPQDPHLLIQNFHDNCVDLQVKMQLTGQSIVLNLIPQGSSQGDRIAYTDALTQIHSPYDIRTGNMYGRYAQTHNFKEKSEGLRHGVPIHDLETIIRLIHETKKRLEEKVN
jgi:DNA-binding transcriptional MerR regulator